MDRPEVAECLDETALGDIPGNTTNKYLAGEDWGLVLPGIVTGRGAVLLRGNFQAGGGH